MQWERQAARQVSAYRAMASAGGALVSSLQGAGATFPVPPTTQLVGTERETRRSYAKCAISGRRASSIRAASDGERKSRQSFVCWVICRYTREERSQRSPSPSRLRSIS